MVDPTFYLPLAQAAETTGYDSFVVPDSICYPLESDSVYPFNPDGTREFLEDKPFIEPFSLIPAMGAVTSTLTFVTFVVKLPLRHPILVAKQASSVAVMTNNRFSFGVGTSPWREDYEMLSLPWERRGKRMDETIEIVSGLLGGGFFEYHGEIFDFDPIKLSPIPTSPVPLLIGGHGEAALRRAARVGDGWLHGGGDLEELPGMLERLRVLRNELGTAERPFAVHVISLDAYSIDGLHRLADQGIDEVIVGFRWPYNVGPDPEALQTKIDNLARYAETVIAPFREQRGS